ncbi:hypothetical protein C8F04DRAFT_1092127 [Mycena alexandri]|uniref:Uncharacterized protein n=1 Tax=Mycena alexandri TaxID=1745969 RepID=A0AAD6X9R8_9AGAR|nr:hypothetical protein C8F04DRAFT_1092127 [Mycena alexandri]
MPINSIDDLLALPELRAQKVDSTSHSLHRLQLAYWGKNAPDGDVWDLTRPILEPWSEGKLVVFEEYLRILEVIDVARQKHTSNPVAHQGVLITGSPGIGKTSSLWFILVTYLCRAEPIVFYYQDKIYVFTASGVYFVASGEVLQTDLFSNILCLVDMDWGQAPGPGALRNEVLLTSNQTFVVGASSPDEDRYHFWMKQARILTFVLEAPTTKDLSNLCRLTDRNFQESDFPRKTKSLLAIFGPDLRRLVPALLEHNVDNQQDLVRRHIAEILAHIRRLGSDDLFRLFQRPDQVSDTFSHTLIETHRSPLFSKDDHLVCHRIRSRMILRLVLQASQREKLARMRYMYMSDLFRASSPVAASKGWVFESLCHARICAMDTLLLLPMTRDGNRLSRNLKDSPFEIPIGERKIEIYTSHSTAQSTANPATYYVPAEGNNPTFDAFIHGPPGFSVGFQMFVGKSRDVKEKGMTLLRKRLHNYDAARDWKATPIKFVFVVPQQHNDVVVDLPGPGRAFTDIQFFVLEMPGTEHEMFAPDTDTEDSGDEMDID